VGQLDEAKGRELKLLDIVQSQARLLEDKRPQEPTRSGSGAGNLAVLALGLGLLAVLLVLLMVMRQGG
jgi:hypothetical protein